MDESEKRRERLKAMRMECAQTELSTSPVPFATAGRLSNPLVQSSVTTPSTETSPGLPRFEYYTDPMSAYSSNKMRNKDYHQIPQESCPPHTSSSPVSRLPPSLSVGMRSPVMNPSVPYQFQMNYSADQRSHGTQHSTATPSSWRSPIPMGNLFPGPGGTLTPGAADQRPYGTPHSIGTGSSWRSPIHMGSPFPRPGGTPILGAAGCNQPLGWPADGVSSSPSPSYGQGSSPSHNSVNHQFNYSSSPSTGRGGGRGRTPSSGQGRGRGRGLLNSPAAKERPDLYYKTSMVQDPWNVLKPILRNLPTTLKYLKATASEKPWLPKSSVSMKKAKVSEEAAGFQSKPSLAECLALSLEEAVNDTEESEVALI